MTALPSNRALVADDLARATLRDARREQRRRRLVTCAVAFALFALTATAAIASGWLFGDEQPVVRVVPSLAAATVPVTIALGGNVAPGDDLARSEARHRAQQPAANRSSPLGVTVGAPRTLLADLGIQKRSITSVPTTTGGVCLTLSGYDPECVPTFGARDHVDWFVSSTPGEPAVVWGIVSDEVTSVSVVSSGDDTTQAEIGNGAFYAEVTNGSPARLIIRLRDGSSETLEPQPCPLTTPDCTP